LHVRPMLKKKTPGSAQSLRRQIAESRNRLYRVALAWCGDSMLADDLVQETLETGVRKLRQLRNEERLFAWLYSILNNAWKSHLRRRRSASELDEQMPADDAGPCDNCEQLELVNRVRSVIRSLPGIERQVIALVDLDGLSYCDVAEALDIPVGTVMSRLHRARKHLLERIERQSSVTDISNGRIHLVE